MLNMLNLLLAEQWIMLTGIHADKFTIKIAGGEERSLPESCFANRTKMFSRKKIKQEKSLDREM